MTSGANKQPTRAELVRRRRAQVTRQRHVSARASATTVRPLVSRPRVSGTGPARAGRRRFEIALPGAARLQALALPHLSLSWRMASLSMLLLLVGMLARLLTDPRLYVDGINLGGASLVPGEEIYAATGLARQHIFWADPREVERRLEAVPGIASATVRVEWPNRVTVLVTERVPVITWIEAERRLWVDSQGNKFDARGDVPGLLPITVDGARGEFMQDRPVPLAAIQGALQLKKLRGNIELLHYDDQHGLSYQDGRGWRGYFGVGTDMEQKLAVYETLVDNLQARGITPAHISVEDLDAPYYRR